ncbi:taste receptor type 2 member 2-like [Anomaloglossus baeobatrachus]|uniref:taste receptor type 2 member 2-like n=1 Tax=Anomaloglossus baeobatrachus TaxID=238106 RepID=UPI003F503628
MADYTEEDAYDKYLNVFAIITLIPGLVIHSFIIGVNVNDWWKGRSVTSVDHVITSLAITRMGSQCGYIIFFFIESFLQSSQYLDVILSIFSMSYPFFTYCNIWLTSLLSIVFCLKISTLRTRQFLHLRRMILPRTGHFIVASGLISAVSCLLTLWINVPQNNDDGSHNTTIQNQLYDDGNFASVYYFNIGAFIPMIFYLISSIFLFASLYHHTVKMKMSSNVSINLETYYSAMKFISITFIYNIIYVFGLFAHIVCSVLYGAGFSWLNRIFVFLPSLHSSYLIYRTAKLRSQMSEALQSFIDLLFPRKSTETRNNIELVDQ